MLESPRTPAILASNQPQQKLACNRWSPVSDLRTGCPVLCAWLSPCIWPAVRIW